MRKHFSTMRLLKAIEPIISAFRYSFTRRLNQELLPCVQCEQLESRQLLAFPGTGSGADSIYMKLDNSATHLQAWVNHDPNTAAADVTYTLPLSNPFSVEAGDGDDVLTLDLVNGNPFASGGFVFRGQGGNDQLKVIGRGTVRGNAWRRRLALGAGGLGRRVESTDFASSEASD